MKSKLLNIFTDNYIIFCVYALIGWIYEVSWYLINQNKFINRGVLFGPFLPIYGFGILILLFILRKFMRKRHEINNFFVRNISVFTVVSFITITIIEYTHEKIYRVDLFLERYGILLIIINLICMFLVSILIKSSKSDKIKKIDLTCILVFLLIWIITTVIEYVSHFVIDKYTGKMLWDYTYDFLNINKRVNWDASRNFALGGTMLLYLVHPMIEDFLDNTKLRNKIIISLLVGIPMFIDFILNVIM